MEKPKTKKQIGVGTKKKEADFKLSVYSKEGKIIGKFTPQRDVFGRKPNDQLISQAIRVYQDYKGKLASTKSRSEVSGGGRKPWRQKGTGRARAGTIRAPQWRGGGVVFGPTPSKSVLGLTKKMRKAALSVALSSKYKNGDITLIDKISFKEPKTKKALEILEKLPINNKRNILLILDSDQETKKSFRNLENIKITKALDLNVFNVVKSAGLIFTLDSIKKLEERFVNGRARGS